MFQCMVCGICEDWLPQMFINKRSEYVCADCFDWYVRCLIILLRNGE
jgi:hypothetical protein